MPLNFSAQKPASFAQFFHFFYKIISVLVYDPEGGGDFMDPKEEMKMEWEKVMASLNKMQEMMQGMNMEGMEDMKMEWEKMMESAGKLQSMM